VIWLTRDHLLEIGGYLVALLLPVAFNPFAIQLFEAVKVPVFQVITIGMGIVATLAFIQKRGQHHGLLFRGEDVRLALVKWFTDNPLLLPVLLYAGVYIMASLVSIDPRRSFWGISTRHGTVTVLSTVLFFLLIASALRTSAQVDRVITALIVGSVPVAIYGWVQYFGLDPFDWTTPSLSPVHSTVGYSLFLGAYMAMVIPFTLFRILGGQSDGQKRPFPYILILVLQIMCLLFTLSRGARLGLLGGCMLFLWLLAYRWRMRSLFIFSVIVLIAGSYLFISMNKSLVVAPLTEQNGLIDALIVQARKVSNNVRMMLWIKTLPMISRRYLLGYGPETYSIAFWRYYPPEAFPKLARFHFWDPHNIFLYQLTATGVLGFLAYLWILVGFYKITLTALQRGVDRRTGIMVAAILGSTTAFLIQAQFNPNAIVPVALFWLVLALGVSIYRRQGADRSE
jgi:putative inorganic carbon (HCO3(-)) transporter